MFNRKKEAEPKRKHDLSQFGIFEVPDFENMHEDGESGDDDFEAELAAITAGNARAKPKPQKAKLPVAPSDLDKMIADSMRDIGSDEELSDGDDDPDLLDELSAIAGSDDEIAGSTSAIAIASEPAKPTETIMPTTTMSTIELIQSRLEMYRLAEKNAKDAGDSSKVRSRGRGVKSLEAMLRQAKAGKPVNVDEIPPEVSTNVSKNPSESPNQVQQPMRTAPPIPGDIAAPQPEPEPKPEPEPEPEPASDSAQEPIPEQAPTPEAIIEPIDTNKPSGDESIINALLDRQREYKLVALAAKKSGDTATALQYIKIVKIFDTVLASARRGESVDLSDMPPPPSELPADILHSIGKAEDAPTPTQHKEENDMQQSSDIARPPEPAIEPTAADQQPPQAPSSILEALIQRLQKYQSVEANAKADGNERKVRQTARIVKQYQDAIRMQKAGRPVAFDELPTPPGFAPLPNTAQSQPEKPAQPPVAARQPAPAQTPSSTADDEPPQKPSPTKLPTKPSNTSVMGKTIEILLERHREFKEAAIEAKKAGDLELAKEYLRTFKGIENLLNVAKGGLPVDLSSLPISPKQRETLDLSFEMIDDKDETNISDDVKDVFHRLEKQLQNQLEKCKNMSEHHKALGDVAATNRFDNLALTVQRDLDIVSLAHRRGGKVPAYHFEQKSFNVVKCNTDLAETELEIQVVRGISYNVTKPRDVDTFVKVEFPYPQDTPYRNKTTVIYNTDNPDYNEKFVAEIHPKQRQCQRMFKRHGIKLEVFEKGGFFRSDTLIGTAVVKLQPLEATCEIHDSFDLMDGRKATGGKLEVKVRVRNPIAGKQVASETEKWLILK